MLAKVKKDTLDVVAAMVVGKQGVFKHHAEDAEAKLREKGFKPEANILKNKLTIFSCAQALHTEKIFLLEPDELHKALTTVLPEVTELPIVVCKDLLAIERDSLLREAKSKQGISAIFELTYPWPTDAENAMPFDPFQPRLCQLNLEPEVKIKFLTSTMIKNLLVPFLMKGESGVPRALDVLDVMEPRIEKAAGSSPDLSPVEVQALCDYLLTFRYFRQLLDPSTLLHADADLTVYSTKAFSGEGPFDLAVSSAKETPFYSSKIQELTNPKILLAIDELGPVIETHIESLANSAADRMLMLVSLQMVSVDLGKIQARLPKQMIEKFEGLALRSLKGFFSEVLKSNEGHRLDLQLCAAGQKILSEFSTSYPMDHDIPDFMAQMSSFLRDAQLGSHRDALNESVAEVHKNISAETLKNFGEQMEASRGLVLTETHEVAKWRLVGSELLDYVLKELDENMQVQEGRDTVATTQMLAKMMQFIPTDHPSSDRQVPRLIAEVVAFQHALQLSSAMQSARALQPDGSVLAQDSAAIALAMEDLQRQMLQLKGLLGVPILQGGSDAVVGVMHKIQESAAECLANLADKRCSAIVTAVAPTVEILKPLKGGVKDGSWLDGLAPEKHGSLKDVMAHGATTIANCKEVAAMIKEIDVLTEAHW
jgi:hypothetical protein